MLTFRIQLNYPWGTHWIKVAFLYQTLLTDKDTALVGDVWATGNHPLLSIARISLLSFVKACQVRSADFT